MPIYRLETETRSRFAEAREIYMAVQFGKSGDSAFLIVSGTVALIMDDRSLEQLQSFPISRLPSDTEGLNGRIRQWVAGLDPAPRDLLPADPFTSTLIDLWRALGFAYAPLPGTPHHIPFVARTNGNDVFYRWEPFPTSIKINQGTNTIAADTFAAPFSEVEFIPSGFAAVARYALPQPFPACWRWELQPVVSDIRCGASVPMHGQSGGGGEVIFLRDTKNRGPIANQVVLPAM